MRTKWTVRIVKFLVFALIVFAVFGQVVHYLWNWLMPNIFGLHTITFWQALGLMALSWILFGGLRGGRHSRRSWRRGMWERWERMSPGEREEFVKGLRSRYGHTPSPADEPKT